MRYMRILHTSWNDHSLWLLTLAHMRPELQVITYNLVVPPRKIRGSSTSLYRRADATFGIWSLCYHVFNSWNRRLRCLRSALGQGRAFRGDTSAWNDAPLVEVSRCLGLAKSDPPKDKDPNDLHPQSLTWNLKIAPWKSRFLLETIIFGFHLKILGCTPDTINANIITVFIVYIIIMQNETII